ncbi:hypothetical protein Tco_1554229 [Tanacetum coccineum]
MFESIRGGSFPAKIRATPHENEKAKASLSGTTIASSLPHGGVASEQLSHGNVDHPLELGRRWRIIPRVLQD